MGRYGDQSHPAELAAMVTDQTTERTAFVEYQNAHHTISGRILDTEYATS